MTDTQREGDARLADVLREERGRLIGALVRQLGDWDAAEELVQDAAVAALEYWPSRGIPDAARAELLRRSGDRDGARAANLRAIAITDNPAERRLLEARLAHDVEPQAGSERSDGPT